MRRAVLVLSCVLGTSGLLGGCATPPPPQPKPVADPTDMEMMRAMDRWLAAFNAHDSAKLVALYADDAFMVVGPRSSKPQKVQRYFDGIKDHAGQSAQWVGNWSYNHDESDHIGVADRDLQITETLDGKSVSRTVRFAMIFVHREGRWQILAHVMTEPPWPVPEGW